MKYYLGMTLPQSHDFTITLINELGQILFIGEEERFNRIKHNQTPRMTFQALEYGLAANNIKVEDIQQVVIATNRNKYGEVSVLRRILRKKGIRVDNLAFVEHHLSHACSSFYSSSFKEATILTIDGIGDNCSWAIFHGKDNMVKKIDHQMAPDSIGYLYLIVTLWLGLGGFGNEGKTMGLASYGEPQYVSLFEKHIINFDEINHRIVLHKNIVDGFGSIDPLIKIFGQQRNKHDEITQYHKDIAASLQKVTEDIMLKLVAYACSLTRCSNVCLAGGVALNSVANGKILDSLDINQLYISPLASDLGNCVGAVYELLSHKQVIEHSNDISAYMGADIDNAQIEKAAKDWNVPYSKLENPEHEAALAIASGKIIGWIQGKAEIGPRALGNRSILGNPQLPNIRDLINTKIKCREIWRPFAPSILKDDKEIYFKNYEVGNQYMTTVLNFKDEYKDVFKSVVHIDGTGRVQYVNKEINESYNLLLTEMKNITGFGVVLNTSFNLAGEPIVNSADDAIKDFLVSDMDELYINNYQFKKENIHYNKDSINKRDYRYQSIKNPIVIFINNLNYIDGSKEYLDSIKETFKTYRLYSTDMENAIQYNNIMYLNDVDELSNHNENDCIIIKLNTHELCTKIIFINKLIKKCAKKVYIATSRYDLVDVDEILTQLQIYSLIGTNNTEEVEYDL